MALDAGDADFFWLLSFITSGPWGIVCAIIALVITLAVCQAEDDCAERSCPAGATPMLVEGRCVCLSAATAP